MRQPDAGRADAGTFDRFIDADRMSDREVAEFDARLEIDIAVDLNGFTGGARPNIFAPRPAPVQVNYLGYPGRWGQLLRLHHRGPIPSFPGTRERLTPRTWSICRTRFMANDRRAAIAGPRRASGSRAAGDGFVFCSFNNSYKITPDDVRRCGCGCCRRSTAACCGCWKAMPRRPQPPREARRGRRPIGWYSRGHGRARRTSGAAPLAICFSIPSIQCPHHGSDALWAGLPVLTCAGATLPDALPVACARRGIARAGHAVADGIRGARRAAAKQPLAQFAHVNMLCAAGNTRSDRWRRPEFP